MSSLKKRNEVSSNLSNKIYYNQVMDRGAMRQLIGRLLVYLGSNCTSQVLDQLKTLGFSYATKAGISLGIDDLITTPSKTWLIRDAEYQAHGSEEEYRRGSIHAVEKLRHVVETWHTTSEYLKREMTSHFRITDPLNPVHIMSFSGARGNVSQVHQLVGMRGLMANPQGNIIDLPIQSNLREGLSLTEYIISCYGARKGVVDTAVRTADAGYLTRRLVEVVQHVVIRNLDCETTQGIRLQAVRERKIFSNKDLGTSSLLSLQERLVGRILARNVFLGSRCIAIRNQDLAPDLVNSLVHFSGKGLQEQGEIVVRSPLTCTSMPRACQRCYGWDLSCGNLVEIGSAIGIVAGQSIGEPGTQLTLRTFHTGGVFTGGVAEHVRAPFNGIIQFSAPFESQGARSIQSTRTRHGRPAWTCPEAFSVVIEDLSGKKKTLNIPQYSLLLVKNQQYVQSRQIIAEVRASVAPLKEKIEKKIFSHSQGEVIYNLIGFYASCLRQRYFLHFLCSSSRINLWIEFASIRNYLSPFIERTSFIWIFSGGINRFLTSTLQLAFLYQTQDYIQRDRPIGLRNQVFRDTRALVLSIYSRPRSFVKKLVDQTLSDQKSFPGKMDKDFVGSFESDNAQIGSSTIVNIFSTHTGLIHTISEQKEWILTLSSKDQFSKRITTLERKDLSSTSCQTLLSGSKQLQNKDFYIGLLGSSVFHWLRKKVFFCLPAIDCQELRDDHLRVGQAICSSHNLKAKSLAPSMPGMFPESGHILSLTEDTILIQLAKLYLVPTGSIAHCFHRQGISEGDTLVTLAYERLKSSDIIQGLPKAEQLLEARVGNQVVMNLYMRFDILVARIKDNLRNYVGSLPQMDLMLSQISVNRATKALQYSQLEAVDQVQKVYLSQGVYIADKHFEVIVRQMSGKVAIVENTDSQSCSPKSVVRTSFPYGVFGVFFPGELLDIAQAQRMNRVLHRPIPCKPVLLGITQASLNAKSFLSEASFERTIPVLSRSALQGRMDWLKGLKENVLLSRMIPAGTGLSSPSLLWITEGTKTLFSRDQQDQKCFFVQQLRGKRNQRQRRKIFSKVQPVVYLWKPFISKKEWLHKSLKQLTEHSLNYETKKNFSRLPDDFIFSKKESKVYFSLLKTAKIL